MADRRPVCVVIDTNVWLSELLLRTPMGAAILYAIHRSKSRIGMPEVIERELRKHVVRVGMEAVDEVKDALAVLQRIAGAMPEIELPSKDELATQLDDRLAELSPLFDRVPFTIEHARLALDRVDAGIAPNGEKNQQFKDSATWEAVLDLAQAMPVILITRDNAFYEGRKPAGGLAGVLRREAEERGVEVEAYASVADAAKQLRESTPPIEKDVVALTISASVERDVASSVGSAGFEIVSLRRHDLSSFDATEDHRVISVSFELEYETADTEPEGERRESRAIVTGSCAYNPEDDQAFDVTLDRLEVTWINPDGSEAKSANVFVRASLHIGGRRSVPLQIREPID